MVWSSDKIRSLRLSLGWSRAEFARRTGTTRMMVHDWEHSKTCPHAQSIEFLDQLLGENEIHNHKVRLAPLIEQRLVRFRLAQLDFRAFEDDQGSL